MFGVINGEIDCPSLLLSVQFLVPTRTLRSFYPFYIKNLTTNYARYAPIARSLRELNEIANSITLDFSLPKNVFSNLLNSIFF